MKYLIKITEVTTYEKKETVYESSDGKRYYSKYSIPEGVKFTEKNYPTGEIGTTQREVYEQEVEMQDYIDVIKAANGLIK